VGGLSERERERRLKEGGEGDERGSESARRAFLVSQKTETGRNGVSNRVGDVQKDREGGERRREEKYIDASQPPPLLSLPNSVLLTSSASHLPSSLGFFTSKPATQPEKTSLPIEASNKTV